MGLDVQLAWIEDIMSLEIYTRNIPLTEKARFWGNFVSSLKGGADLYAAPEPNVTNWNPSITETLPPAYSGLKQEFGKLESLMWNQKPLKRAPTPTLPDANDRIHTVGYDYCPVHTEIYGTYRNQAKRGYAVNWSTHFPSSLLF